MLQADRRCRARYSAKALAIGAALLLQEPVAAANLRWAQQRELGIPSQDDHALSGAKAAAKMSLARASSSLHGGTELSAALETELEAAIDAMLQAPRPTHSLVSAKRAVKAVGGHAANASAATGMGYGAVVAKIAAAIDPEKVIHELALPPEVASLVHHMDGKKNKDGETGAMAGAENPKKVEEAVKALNGMIVPAQKRLDTKTDQCAVSESKATQTMEQITADLARLGQEASNVQRTLTSTMGATEAVTLNLQQVKEELERETVSYTTIRKADVEELAKRKANLEVSTFVLEFTKCQDAPSAAMLQGSHNASQQLTSTSFQVCRNATGGAEIKFSDKSLEEAVKKLTPEAQGTLLGFALGKQAALPLTPKTASMVGKADLARSKLEAAAMSKAMGFVGDREDGDSPGDRSTEENGRFQEDDDTTSPALLKLGASLKASNAPPACETSITHTVISKSHKLCQTPAGGRVQYTGVQCEEGTIQWVSAKALDVAKGKKAEDCQWDFLKLQEKEPSLVSSLGGSCGVPPTLSGSNTLPMLCQVAKPLDVIKPEPAELKAAHKCSQADPHCAVLHDLFASLWGEMKDLVDETTAKIAKNDASWAKLKTNINGQLQAFSVQHMSLDTAMAEATSSKAAITEEQKLKQKEYSEVGELHFQQSNNCKAAIREMLYTEICGITSVRNAIIKEHLEDAPKPVDCAVSDWVAGECSSPCDEKLAGGKQTLTREILVESSERGTVCPALETTRKCNQIKCPVDCKLSEYSTWGKCTKECGGGVQARSRSVQSKPMNGGQACDALQETRACNMGSCDVDCELSDWSAFKPCTRTCNSGFEERRKGVVTKAAGDGSCPVRNSKLRVERKACNTQACKGFMVCASMIDLVIMIDGSGSVTQQGFEVLKHFAKSVVERLDIMVRVAVVQFGNGKLNDKKIVSDAIAVTPGLEEEVYDVADRISALKWQQGFTNMAQAFFKAKDYLGGSREKAESVVLLLTDGRPSFKYQTNLAVKKLRESARLVIVHVQPFRKQEMVELLKGYASNPWRGNYLHIPGKEALKEGYESYATSVLSMLCPGMADDFSYGDYEADYP
eukprot:TRINITY_DN609_c0_g1_i1.p1 TRINITY_DN609_c0_g1~~TRINITY_DN609_c0_g1_i1.p1  ORF type:complete len:1079 (-),score=306.41 TRINITY_DN609_c0_g1_i1:261-3497(-)